MSWFSKSVRKVYDATSKSSSRFGRFGKWAVPFNAPYLTRDAWRSISKRLSPTVRTSTPVNSASSLHGVTGSIVGKY